MSSTVEGPSDLALGFIWSNDAWKVLVLPSIIPRDFTFFFCRFFLNMIAMIVLSYDDSCHHAMIVPSLLLP